MQNLTKISADILKLLKPSEEVPSDWVLNNFAINLAGTSLFRTLVGAEAQEHVLNNLKIKKIKGTSDDLINWLRQAQSSSEDVFLALPRTLRFLINNSSTFSTIIKTYIYEKADRTVVDSALTKIIPLNPNMGFYSSSNIELMEKYGVDLTQKALDGELDPVIGRDEEVQRVMQILIRKTKRNPILIGEAGTGKTAIVEGLAEKIARKDGIPLELLGTRIWQIDIAKVVGEGQAAAEVLMSIMDSAAQDDSIIFIDEFHLIMSNDLLKNALKPAMARSASRLIGATTNDEFKLVEKDNAMTRRTQPVRITEMSDYQVLNILEARARGFMDYFSIVIPDESMVAAIKLSNKFLAHRNQPDKSIDLIEEAGSILKMRMDALPDELSKAKAKVDALKMEIRWKEIEGDEIDKEELKKSLEHLENIQTDIEAQKELIDQIALNHQEEKEIINQRLTLINLGEFNKLPELDEKLEELKAQKEELIKASRANLNFMDPGVIKTVIEKWTGIPASAQEEDIERYKNLPENTMQVVKGQEDAVYKITSVIQNSMLGFVNANKPVGSFLLLGPTGVGKTLTAQTISKCLFDTDKTLHRFDMSEYMEGHAVSRLFGSPPGYVGHDRGGQLTDAVWNNPYSVILFDEIEKAHPRVMDALLQVLDAGRLTDGQGKEVDFKNTIILMTSNLSLDNLGEFMRPEMINRFDAIVNYNALSLANIIEIADSELSKMAKLVKSEHKIDLVWSNAAPLIIAAKAYDPSMGARPITRFINDFVVSQLTQLKLNGELDERSKVTIRVVDEALKLEVLSDEESKDCIEKENQFIADNLVKEKMQETFEEPKEKKANVPKKKKAKKKKKPKKAKGVQEVQGLDVIDVDDEPELETDLKTEVGE